MMDEEYLMLERDAGILDVALKAVGITDNNSYEGMPMNSGFENKQVILDAIRQAKLHMERKQRIIARMKED